MQDIEISEKISESFYSVAPAAWALAADIGARHAPYEEVTLAVDLSQFRLPNVGTVQVPIDFAAHDPTGVPPYEFGVRIASRSSEYLFPRFEGQIHLLDESGTDAWIFLRGHYAVPMGRVGAVIDRSLFHNVAVHSLQGFLHWFARETAARVKRGDFETAQQMMRRRDG